MSYTNMQIREGERCMVRINQQTQNNKRATQPSDVVLMPCFSIHSETAKPVTQF